MERNAMTDYKLKIDPDDLSELLVMIEKSFDIKFGDTELEESDINELNLLNDIIRAKKNVL